VAYVEPDIHKEDEDEEDKPGSSAQVQGSTGGELTSSGGSGGDAASGAPAGRSDASTPFAIA